MSPARPSLDDAHRSAAAGGAGADVVRSIPDTNPAKWHLAHTSWLFETVVQRPHTAACRVRYAPRNERYAFLFDSYYIQAGERHCHA
jgi:hypothetical protein